MVDGPIQPSGSNDCGLYAIGFIRRVLKNGGPLKDWNGPVPTRAEIRHLLAPPVKDVDEMHKEKDQEGDNNDDNKEDDNDGDEEANVMEDYTPSIIGWTEKLPLYEEIISLMQPGEDLGWVLPV